MKNGKSRTGAAVLTLMLLSAAVWQFQPGGMAERMAQTDGEGAGAARCAGSVRGTEKDLDDLTPVYGDQVADGEYDIEVESSSHVSGYKGRSDGGGRAYVRRSDSGRNGIRKAVYGYRRRSGGSGEDSYIPFVEDGTGAYTYEVPAEVLNQPVDCAAWSIRKEQWYDRNSSFWRILFSGSSEDDSSIGGICYGCV